MRALLAVLLVTGCVGDDAAPADAAPDVFFSLPDAWPTGTYEGVVFLRQGHDDFVGASFADGPILGPVLREAGGCVLQDWDPDLRWYSAGAITVAGADAPITLTPDGPAPEARYSGASATWAPGATLTVTAAGGDVPAFSGQVVAPAALDAFIAPSSLSRSQPATIDWTAGDGDAVWIWIYTVGATTATEHVLRCTVPDTGSATVPAEALALLSAAEDAGLVLLYRVNYTDLVVGLSSVHLWAASWQRSQGVMIGP